MQLTKLTTVVVLALASTGNAAPVEHNAPLAEASIQKRDVVASEVADPDEGTVQLRSIKERAATQGAEDPDEGAVQLRSIGQLDPDEGAVQL